ncbi:DUF1788 domain-containing protein [Enterococcus sp. CWB-B31]|uniref:DUF1788 domain-containing protein n=1 Tax=Enterococcus sp. CWB-B31 TaxID=2885159 RepID=UPI001E5C7CA5|nr:DUF1788 domain-containing protein [Enterococcus sp. CWB-B31]MCB5955578.1 DUF1788 domain-containing protein [Enterococcus sp. CWB-B31]
MENELYRRLDTLLEKMSTKDFQENKGLGNEVGYYVFDYPEQEELKVRDWIETQQRKNNSVILGYTLKVFNLFDILLDLLKEEDILEDTYDIEEEQGIDGIIGAITDLVEITETNNNNYFVSLIRNETVQGDVVFITGVGEIFPLIRSHKVLNTMNLSLDTVPIVMFFPGKYDGATLKIFDKEVDDNYYRAFRIV